MCVWGGGGGCVRACVRVSEGCDVCSYGRCSIKSGKAVSCQFICVFFVLLLLSLLLSVLFLRLASQWLTGR